MQKWRRSEYSFKSPHWKNNMGKIFNKLNEVAGDPRRLPGTPGRNRPKEYRNTPQFEAVSREIVDKLDAFSKLKKYNSLKQIETTLPLRYIFVLPARHGLVVYSAYSNLLSRQRGRISTFEEVQEYLGIPIKKDDWDYNYLYVYYLILNFQLYKITHPFRSLLNLRNFSRWYGKITFKNTDFILNNIERMNEWKSVSSPSEILKKVYKILNKHGFQVALQFVRYLFRGSWKIRGILDSEYTRDSDPEKVRDLTKRYLTIQGVLDGIKKTEKYKEKLKEDTIEYIKKTSLIYSKISFEEISSRTDMELEDLKILIEDLIFENIINAIIEGETIIFKNIETPTSSDFPLEIESTEKTGLFIFVSYATKDAEIYNIREIALGLEKFEEIQRVLYWQADMHDDIIKYMNDNLGKCDVVLLFCSPNALKSVPVQKEWNAAEAMNKPIVPVFTNPDYIPPLLRSRLGTQFDPFNIQKAVEDLYDLILKKSKELK